jgi:hypothetical protein
MPERRPFPRSPLSWTLAAAVLGGSLAFAQPPAPEAAPAPPAAAPAAGTPAAAEPKPRPKIAVAAPVFDAGPVRKGKRVEVDFALENRGEAPLEIKDAQPSCGCTVAAFDREIAPGATGKLHATLATDTFDGPIAKHVTVLSNDPETPRLVLTIKAEVQSYLKLSPTYARILKVQTQPAEKVGVNLWATDGTPLAVRTVETPADWVVAAARRATESERAANGPSEQLRVEIWLDEEAPVGPLAGAIRVETNHPKQPEVEIQLSGNVRRLLHLQPAEADFGKLVRPTRGGPRFVVKLHNFGKEPVEVRSVATDLPFVTASVSADEPGRRFRIELLLAPDAPKGKFEGKLAIETSSDVMPRLEAPVRGKVD